MKSVVETIEAGERHKDGCPRTQHTPGPWEYMDKSGPSGKAWGVGQQQRPGKGVAIVIQGEEDARLIAAAPDLLQVVKDYVENADCGNGGEHTEEYGDKRENCWHCKAVAAVAIAEGK